MKETMSLPRELVNLILDYDGRMKYRRGIYVNIIHKHDIRYKIIQQVMNKKMTIMKTTQILDNKTSFYFEFGFGFEKHEGFGLCYDYNFSRNNHFEICYFDFRDYHPIIQVRSYFL
jgi:hypothetical protein